MKLLRQPPVLLHGDVLKTEGKDGAPLYLTAQEYTPQELERFQAESPAWILRRRGSQQFTADSDSGEDAVGYYCSYFDLVPENAVFEEGRFVGFCFRPDWLRYDGRGRSSFDLIDWGYPGDPVFTNNPWPEKLCLFLFDVPETLKWRDWTLMKREPGAEYRSYLEF